MRASSRTPICRISMRVRNSRRQLATSSRKSTRVVGREVEDQPRAVERLLDARQLHRQLARADPVHRVRAGLRARAARCLSRSATIGRRDATHGHGRRGGRLRRVSSASGCGCTWPIAGPSGRLNDDGLADAEARVERLREEKGLRAAGGTETHGHAWTSVGFHGGSLYLRPAAPTPRGRLDSELQHNPVRDGLRTGVALERPERAVDGLKRAEDAVAVERRRQRSSAGRRSTFATARASARVASTPRSRSSAAIACRCIGQGVALARRRCPCPFRRSPRVASSRPRTSRASATQLEHPLRACATTADAVFGAWPRARREAAARHRRDARACASAMPFVRHQPASDVAAATAAQKRTVGHRERTVGSSGRVATVTSTSTEPGGGSSSVLSSAFCAGRVESRRRRRRSTTRRRASNGLKPVSSKHLAHDFDLDVAGVAGLDDHDVGMLTPRDAPAGGALCRTRRSRAAAPSRRPTARAARASRQLSACASASAAWRLPTPSGPPKIRLGGSVPRVDRARQQTEQPCGVRRDRGRASSGPMARIVAPVRSRAVSGAAATRLSACRVADRTHAPRSRVSSRLVGLIASAVGGVPAATAGCGRPRRRVGGRSPRRAAGAGVLVRAAEETREAVQQRAPPCSGQISVGSVPRTK